MEESASINVLIDEVQTEMSDRSPKLSEFRDIIEERYEENPTGAGNSFDEILCYEIHHGSDGEHEGGLTFNWLAEKWGISVTFLGELIADHCKRL